MTGSVRKALFPVLAGAAVVVGTAAPAGASVQTQDGLVNVAVGDITLTDVVDVNVAAAVAANVCNVAVGPVAVLATQVDATNNSVTVCTANNEPVTIVNA